MAARAFTRRMCTVAQDRQGWQFFNRKQELAGLSKLLQPSCLSELVVVNGPKDSGKSALISEFVRRQKLDEYPGISFIADLRDADAITPQGVARLLKTSIFDFFPLETTLTGKLGELEGKYTAVFKNVETTTSLSPLLSAIRSYGLDWKTASRKGSRGYENAFPTLIIDEANLLREWTLTPEMQRELRRLLEYFVKVTKQEGLMNVVLLSSESFFPTWIEQLLGSSRCITVTVGDLAEEEARAFVTMKLMSTGKEELLTDELWRDIYGLVGGRTLLLARAAKHLDEWKMLKTSLLSKATSELKRALDLTSFAPGYSRISAPAWNAAQWREAMKIVVDHEDGVTPYSKLSHLSGKVVDSFIEYDLLSYRSDTGLSRDYILPPLDFAVVMPSSRVYYRAMQKLTAKVCYNLK